MVKRQFILFLSFLGLFILFVFFQNFSFLKINNINTHDIKKRFIPEYYLYDSIGTLALPSGFKEQARLQSPDRRVVFDDKKYLKDTLQSSAVYRTFKDYIETTREDFISEESSPEAKSLAFENTSPRAPASETDEESFVQNIKVKANPGRKEASVHVASVNDISTNLNYCAEDQNISIKVKRQLGTDAQVQLKMDSKDQSSSFLWSLSW